MGTTSLGGGEVTGGRGFGVVSGEAVRQQRDMQQQGMPPVMPPSQPGGEGMGIRTPRTPARPQARGSPGAGAPVTSVQQRGPQPSISQRNQQALMNGRRLRGA